MTLKDVYSDESLINYRVIVMCPGHLVEKWTNEIRLEIPYAKTEILNDFKQLVSIREKGIERQGREFYIIGKDFCKLSYSFIPVPYQIKKKRPIKIVCKNCQSAPEDESDYRLKRPCKNCGGELIKEKNGSSRRGLVCPDCGELIMKDKDGSDAVGPAFFTSKSDANEKCRYCGSSFWTSHVMNLDSESSVKPKEKHWYKVSHYTNKAKKSRTTSWVLRGYESTFLEAKGLMPDEIEVGKEILTRKVAPAGYIKNHLKRFFDFSVFDEVHLLKGGDTAQGNAMHSLVIASKKRLGLTGTIAGGMAHHIYYLLWRLDPQRMRRRGFAYSDEIEFVKRYGTLETLYELPESSVVHNSSSRGRKISSPTAKPGISPLIFRDFLIDKAVTLDLSDLSRYLPKLFENVVTVPCDDDVRYEYSRVIFQLKQAGGHRMNPLTSAMLQFSLSYLDKPFGYGNIVNPKTGSIAASPNDYDYSCQLLPKEEKLVELINQEQAEGRNVFVYCEYTGDGPQNVTKRIKDIIERNCGLRGKVAILESSNPPAAEREEWIHKKASEDIRVIISNPRCVETGCALASA